MSGDMYLSFSNLLHESKMFSGLYSVESIYESVQSWSPDNWAQRFEHILKWLGGFILVVMMEV